MLIFSKLHINRQNLEFIKKVLVNIVLVTKSVIDRYSTIEKLCRQVFTNKVQFNKVHSIILPETHTGLQSNNLLNTCGMNCSV